MVHIRRQEAESHYAQGQLYRLPQNRGMAQKPIGAFVLPELYRRRYSHSRQPIGAIQAREPRLHTHPDVRRETVQRYDADRNARAGLLKNMHNIEWNAQYLATFIAIMGTTVSPLYKVAL